MEWKSESQPGCYSYNEFNGACGYSIMPYKEKGYLLYLRNIWRISSPLGEFITLDAGLSGIYALYSDTITFPEDQLVFETVEQAKNIAEIHKAKGDEPAGYTEEEGWYDIEQEDPIKCYYCESPYKCNTISNKYLCRSCSDIYFEGVSDGTTNLKNKIEKILSKDKPEEQIIFQLISKL